MIYAASTTDQANIARVLFPQARRMARPRRAFSDGPLLLFAFVLLMSSFLLLRRHPYASAFIGGPLASLLVAAPFSPRARFYLRTLSFLVGIATCSAWGVFSAVVVSLVKPSWRKNVQWLVARSFWRMTAPVVGWKFLVEGEEYLDRASKGEPHVLVGNHQSMTDILYLGRIFPPTCVVMAKKELKYTPLLGQFMALSRAVFVNRQNRSDAINTFSRIGDEMKRLGLSLFIFAEGTRSSTPVPALLPFKKGAFHLAIQSSLPIVPIVCETYHSLYHSSSSRFESGTVVIKVLPPVETKGLGREDAGEMGEKVREMMERALEELACREGACSKWEGTEEEKQRIKNAVAEGKKRW